MRSMNALILESRWGWLMNPLLWWCTEHECYHFGNYALRRWRAGHVAFIRHDWEEARHDLGA